MINNDNKANIKINNGEYISETEKVATWKVFISKEGLVFEIGVILLSIALIFIGIENNYTDLSPEIEKDILSIIGIISIATWLALIFSLTYDEQIKNFLSTLILSFIIIIPLGLMCLFIEKSMSEVLFC